jgi:hypothetical protein
MMLSLAVVVEIVAGDGDELVLEGECGEGVSVRASGISSSLV